MNLLEANAVTTKEALQRAFWMVKVSSMVPMAVPMSEARIRQLEIQKRRGREVIEKAHA